MALLVDLILCILSEGEFFYEIHIVIVVYGIIYVTLNINVDFLRILIKIVTNYFYLLLFPFQHIL